MFAGICFSNADMQSKLLRRKPENSPGQPSRSRLTNPFPIQIYKHLNYFKVSYRARISHTSILQFGFTHVYPQRLQLSHKNCYICNYISQRNKRNLILCPSQYYSRVSGSIPHGHLFGFGARNISKYILGSSELLR